MGRIAYAFRNFSKGSLSKQVSGRDDTDIYYSSAEIIYNSLVRPYGNVVNRAGTHYAGAVKTPSNEVRLLKFVISETAAYIIQFESASFRFYTNNGLLTKDETDADVINPWLTATVYTGGQFLLRSGTLYICTATHTSGTFTTDASNGLWYILTETDTSGIWVVQVPHTYNNSEVWYVDDAQKDDILNLVHWVHKQARLKRVKADSFSLGDYNFIGGPWENDNTDTTFTMTTGATSGASISLVSSIAVFTDDMVGRTIKIGPAFGTPIESGYGEIIAVADSTTCTIRIDKVLDTSATSGTDDWAFGVWYTDNYPSVVTYFESRLGFAGVESEKSRVDLSKTFIYDDFNTTSPAVASSAISQVINAERANEIKWLSSGQNLGVGTFGDEFIIGSGVTGGMTQANSNAKRQGGSGSEKIRPSKMSDRLYYVQRGGRKIREFFYQWAENNYKSLDMTKYSEQITLSGIVDMDYAENPDEMLYCVLANGKMAVLTRDVDENVMAWTEFETDGYFKSVRIIPNPAGEIDQVWVIVEREVDGATVKYVEWFENSIVDDSNIQRELFYVDSGLTYDGYDDASGTLTLSAVTGTEITITASADNFLTSDVIGKRIRAIDATTRKMVGELNIITRTSNKVVTGTVTEDFPSTSVAAGDWAVSVIAIDNFDHLEGKEVAILADGAVQERKTVTSGTVTLDSDGFYITAGLPYTSRLLTNPFAYPGVETTFTTKKRISDVGLKVYKTLGITYSDGIGEQPEVRYRQAETPSGLPEDLHTGLETNLTLDGNWDYESRVLIEQTNPLPMNILSIYASVRTGDKK
jgi:hypothetical protein